MAEKFVRIPREKVERIQLYINRDKKSLAEIVRETGATYAINGGLFDMSKFVPNCHLRADGYTYAEDEYNYFGLGWDKADSSFSCVTALNKETVDNYLCCVELVHLGKKIDRIIMNSAQNSSRAKTVVGFYENGDTFMFCSTGGLDPYKLRDRVAELGVHEAIMLDGGGSTQCYFDGEELTAERKVHNLILVYTKAEEDKDMGNFKIALGAGHGINSAGKRCMKALDPNETREWWLSDRVCDYVAEGLKPYEGYSLLRMDDWDDGKDNIELSVRAKTANTWGADVYISHHFNAASDGTKATKASGIVAFSHPNAGDATHALRDELYAALIKHTGLKGDRWDGTLTADFQILRETKMPAVLLELGFMDSSIDVPIILTDAHARKCAAAIVEVLVKRGKLKKKPESNTVYRVQVGAFGSKANAERLMAELKAKGYEAYVR